MKFKLKNIVLTIISILLIGIVIINIETSFTVVATSYVESSTSLYNYKDGNLVEKSTYPIGGVEDIDFNNDKTMFNKYGNELISIKGNNTKNYKVNYNPLQIDKYKEGQYILHNEGINSFSISKYDGDFNILIESDNYPGFPRNFIINNEQIYVLSNVYDQNLHRTVGIYILDINTLKVLRFIKLEGLAFGFYMEKDNNELEIYGNLDETAKNLTIYTYDLVNSKTSLYIKSDVKAMWVSKVLVIDNKKIILNDYSIVSLDENDTIKVEYTNGQTLIDLEYDEKHDIYYLLTRDYKNKKFKVLKLKKNFEVIESIRISTSNKIPTDLVLN